MAESFNFKRVVFSKGQQGKFILQAQKTLSLKNSELANLLNLSSRTIIDWKKEKFLIPLNTAKSLSRKSGVKLPKIIETRKRFWYTMTGASAGGLAVYKKYGHIGGDQKYRKKKWREWWEKEGRHKPHPIINVTVPIHRPIKSTELAEFIGIMLGDGGMTKHQLRITLNYKDDKEYIKFVIKLIRKLFKVVPSIYLDIKNSVSDIAVSRRELIKFCERIGLKTGNKVKQQVDVPDWIKKNKKFQISCLRGLVDTDGSIFIHRYRVNGKWYSYKKLDFSSQSKPLRKFVYKTMQDISLSPRFSQEKSVRLDSIRDMKEYFLIVGSHNQKHLRRYLK